jgi:hypothetical protein
MTVIIVLPNCSWSANHDAGMLRRVLRLFDALAVAGTGDA